jgi:hypothetical protein
MAAHGAGAAAQSGAAGFGAFCDVSEGFGPSARTSSAVSLTNEHRNLQTFGEKPMFCTSKSKLAKPAETHPMKPITAGFILLAFLAAATKPDVLFAGTINIPKVSVPHITVAHLTTPQVNTQNGTAIPFLRFQFSTVTVSPVRWGSTGDAPAGGGGGAGKVHTLNPNVTVIYQ